MSTREGDSDGPALLSAETAPLLGREPTTGSPSAQHIPPQEHGLKPQSRCDWHWFSVVALVIVTSIVSDIGEDLYGAPRLRLFESAICKRYYAEHNPLLIDPEGSVPERHCKVDPVQERLAELLGWLYFSNSVPAILLPIPYGYLADKYGRRWILVGVVEAPTGLVCLSSLFFLLGGGPTTGTTLLTTIVADVVPSELRATVFFYRFCTDLVADLTLPPVTAYLMPVDIWVPLLGGVMFQGIAALMTAMIPETLPYPLTPRGTTTGPGSLAVPQPVPSSQSETSKRATVYQGFRSLVRETAASFSFVTSHSAIRGLVLTFLISKVGSQSTNVLYQYVSKRYGWALSKL
ncbi:uncharacterized protein B0I36DRAFT_396705 [Microdochium trichocladiopsis]|uniref:Major facilitator superfamily domain-containing protein n=1 Tax=Microdochium trichocladiopsis TaxID=1682393 RepID=A0A9P9BJU5_9PEZI|nr:uncharacterized protein B0I36DRAFT_396705 [Microdochium trichocladiopsis]KAH7016374.1 hypothetical protein B0I36DRAFT_396705 [Microdochium trichocladiopsis]